MTSLFKKRQPKHVSAAFCSVSEVEQHLADSEFNIGKIQEIQNKFAGGEILQVPGRVFVREGALVKVCRKGPKKRQFFLFNDVLVYGCILPKNRYGNQHILPLSQMSVSDTCHYLPSVEYSGTGDDKLEEELAFQLNHTNKSFHVFANSVADKNNWIANLRKSIAKASQGRDSDPLIVRAVWVPDSVTTACMQCQQKFSTFVRKHHCRQCGKVVCSACSQNRLELRQRVHITDPNSKPERVCDGCYSNLTQIQPPSATTAAAVVSKALIKQAGPHPSDCFDNNSEESEDSDDSDNEQVDISAVKGSSTAEGDSIVSVVNKVVVEEPTPPPRRKKESKKFPSVQKPPVTTRKKKEFSELHQEFAPSELLDQRKHSDVMFDDQVISDVPEKPRRKKKHFKTSDHVTHGEDHVSHSERPTEDHDSFVEAQLDQESSVTTSVNEASELATDNISASTGLPTVTNISNIDDLIIDDVTDNLLPEHKMDPVITSNDQVIPSVSDEVTMPTATIESPGATRRKKKNKFKPKE